MLAQMKEMTAELKKHQSLFFESMGKSKDLDVQQRLTKSFKHLESIGQAYDLSLSKVRETLTRFLDETRDSKDESKTPVADLFEAHHNTMTQDSQYPTRRLSPLSSRRRDMSVLMKNVKALELLGNPVTKLFGGGSDELVRRTPLSASTPLDKETVDGDSRTEDCSTFKPQ